MRKRKLLLIGGTGTISSGITRHMAKDPNWDVYLFNRGIHICDLPKNITLIKGDINNEVEAARILNGMTFDCVGEFVGFTPDQAERDVRLFLKKTKQYIFISTCMAYNTPPSTPFISEGMLQKNEYSPYAQNKIACEQVLLRAFREKNFPVTIVRPSHTYSERHIPFCLESPKGSWPVISRMLRGKPIIVPGDGSSLWVITMNEDFAKGYAGLVGNSHAIGEAVQITTDEVITWDQMGQAVADALNVTYKPFYIPTDVIASIAPQLSEGLNGDKRHSVIFSTAKLKSLVPDYVPTITWREGVERALDVILNDPSLMPEDPAFDLWCDNIIEIYERALQEAKAKCIFPE